MSRESNSAGHQGKTQRDRNGYPAFHGGAGKRNRKVAIKLDARRRDWELTISTLDKNSGNSAPAGGWETAYHKPGSNQ